MHPNRMPPIRRGGSRYPSCRRLAFRAVMAIIVLTLLFRVTQFSKHRLIQDTDTKDANASSRDKKEGSSTAIDKEEGGQGAASAGTARKEGAVKQKHRFVPHAGVILVNEEEGEANAIRTSEANAESKTRNRNRFHEIAGSQDEVALPPQRREIPYCAAETSRAFLVALNNKIDEKGGKKKNKHGDNNNNVYNDNNILMPRSGASAQLPLHKSGIVAAKVKDSVMGVVVPVAGAASDMTENDIAVILEGTASSLAHKKKGHGKRHAGKGIHFPITMGEEGVDGNGVLQAGWHCVSVVRLKAKRHGDADVDNAANDVKNDEGPPAIKKKENYVDDGSGEVECILAQKPFVTIDSGKHKSSELAVTPHQLTAVTHTRINAVNAEDVVNGHNNGSRPANLVPNEEARRALARRSLIALVPSSRIEGVPSVAAIIHGHLSNKRDTAPTLSAMSVLKGPLVEELLFNSPSDEEDEEVMMLNDPNYDVNAVHVPKDRYEKYYREEEENGSDAEKKRKKKKADRGAALLAERIDELGIRNVIAQHTAATFQSLAVKSEDSADGIIRSRTGGDGDKHDIPLFDGRGSFWITSVSSDDFAAAKRKEENTPSHKRHFYTRMRHVRSLGDIDTMRVGQQEAHKTPVKADKVVKVSNEDEFRSALKKLGMMEGAKKDDDEALPADPSVASSSSPFAIHVTSSITITKHLSFRVSSQCSLLVFSRDAQLVIKEGIVVRMRGETTTSGGQEEEEGDDHLISSIRSRVPLSLTASSVSSGWGGIALQPSAQLFASYCVLSFTGSNGVKRIAGTGTHIKLMPAISVSPLPHQQQQQGGGGEWNSYSSMMREEASINEHRRGGGSRTTITPSSDAFDIDTPFETLLLRVGKRKADDKGDDAFFGLSPLRTLLSMKHSAIINTYGPALGMGKGSFTLLRNVVSQDNAQGLECVECDVSIDGGTFTDFPFVSNQFSFVDEDNDGLYVRGGRAIINNTIIGNALDDGIDSASNKNDPEQSSIVIENSHVFNCQHEGIAISGSEGSTRFMRIAHSVVQRCQQGIENGHSPTTHFSNIYKSILFNNQIGIRYGDDYSLEVGGSVQGEKLVFVDNTVPYLDYVKKEHKDVHTNHYGAFGGNADASSSSLASFLWSNPRVQEEGLSSTYMFHGLGVCKDCRVIHPLPASAGLSSSVSDEASNVFLFLSRFASEGAVCGSIALGGVVANPFLHAMDAEDGNAL